MKGSFYFSCLFFFFHFACYSAYHDRRADQWLPLLFSSHDSDCTSFLLAGNHLADRWNIVRLRRKCSTFG